MACRRHWTATLFSLISLFIYLWILEISRKTILQSPSLWPGSMLWDFLWWGKENTEPSGKHLDSRAGRWCWYLPPTPSSADWNQPEACLATLCLICILNCAGEHTIGNMRNMLHHRKHEKFFIFIFKGFLKNLKFIFFVFSPHKMTQDLKTWLLTSDLTL